MKMLEDLYMAVGVALFCAGSIGLFADAFDLTVPWWAYTMGAGLVFLVASYQEFRTQESRP